MDKQNPATWPYEMQERVAIKMDSGIPQAEAERQTEEETAVEQDGWDLKLAERLSLRQET